MDEQNYFLISRALGTFALIGFSIQAITHIGRMVLVKGLSESEKRKSKKLILASAIAIIIAVFGLMID